MQKTKRVIDFSKYKPVLEIPNLIGMQLASFEEFLQRSIPPKEREDKGLQKLFKEVFPVESYNHKLVLEFIEYNFSEPRYDIRKCYEEELTYSFPLHVKFRLHKKETGEVEEQEVYFEDLPLITEEGSFIINGADRVIVSQLQRAPGIFFKENISSKSKVSFKVNIIPERGSWLEFEVKDDLLYMRVNRGKRFPATLFLRALGGTSEKVLKEFSYPEDREILKRSFEIDEVGSYEDIFIKLYQKLRPGRPLVFESAEEVFKKTFQDNHRYDLGEAGRFRLNKELNLNIDKEPGILHLEDIIEIIKYLFALDREQREIKNSDHLSYKRVRRVGDLLTEQFRIGLTYLSKVIQQRMSIQDPAKVTPRSLVVTQIVKRVINSFFNTGSLSQYLDQTNPLSELTHKRRLTSLGQGGLSRVQAKEEVRDVHYTYYGRICPIETPEGQNIGLLISLATYAHINKLGFLEVPYRKVKKGRATEEIIYLDAREEDNYYIAGIDAIDSEGKFVEPEVKVTHRGEIITIPQEKVNFVNISPKEIVSVTTSLIPFLENDAANRALMGSNMQRQAVPLENPEVPLIKTGIERKIAADSLRATRTKRGGRVTFVDASRIKIETSEGIDEYKLMKFQRSNQRTCINQRSLVNKGDEVKEGEFIADGPAIHNGELALGRNILVAFMPWEGYNFQDAILISEKLVKEDVFTSIHIEEFQVEAKELKSGTEEITSDIPNVEESALKNLDEEGIICIGAEVKSGDILVGKVTPQVEIKLTPEERLLRSIFGEKVQKVKDNSLRVPHGIEGKVIRVKVFSQENNNNLPPSVKERVKVHVAVRRKVSVGDKMCGRHGNKGVVGKILAEEDMPYLPDGTPIEILLNPLGVPSRMNVGQVLETHLGWIAKTLGVEIITPIFEGPKEKKITKLLRNASLPESGKITLCDGRTGESFPEPIAVGYMYMMKLVHLAEEKIHARSTGPYALVTQQPLGGKSREGGQRFGEMEVWALEGYGAAYTLQEMLTSKSDDLQARTNLHEQIIKGENFLVTHVPESFKVLVKELQALGLNLEFYKDREKFTIQDMEKEDKEGDKLWNMNNINKIKIRLASPDEMLKWSHGEVRKTDTINYRTFKPERGGLFCEQIFGPTKSYECSCGKYRKMKYKGIVCERCGVEVTSSRVRRERMGHISLASPVTHIWYTQKYLPSLLGIKSEELERVIYFVNYIVIDPGKLPLKQMQLLDEEKYRAYIEEYGEDSFQAGMGAGAILKILQGIKIEELKQTLREELLQIRTQGKRAKLCKRLEVVESFLTSGNRPEWMILRVIPVIPPDFRPMVQLESGIFANSDLNDLYRRIINRNNRLKYLLEIDAPQIIIRNEKKMLQQSVDALFENEKLSQSLLGAGKRPLKSLSEVLKGKEGRFRQNLLGKRVDYSGRATIVPGPELKIYECGLPKEMALELFRPFVIGEIMRHNKVETIKGANDMIEKKVPFVWEVLEKIVKDHPVLLNRAPTLHRLGVQAFQPVLIESSAIQLHPLVCTAFNADFDGDTMAIHLPLSYEAQLESRLLMLSSNNLLSPANGEPIVTPTEDITVGCYYLTVEKDDGEEEKIFSSPEEVSLAYELGKVKLHQKIKVRWNGEWVETIPGRVIFNQVFPEGMEFENREVDKKVLSDILSKVWRKYGNDITIKVLDKIKSIGFAFATQSALTLSMSDIPDVPEKERILKEAEDEVEGFRLLAEEGGSSEEERYIDTIDVWMRTIELIEAKVLHYLSLDPFNPLLMMWKSGARGTKEQLCQIVGIRGLMSMSVRETYRRELWDEAFKRELNISPQVIRQYFYPVPGGKLKGRIAEEPIRSSFKEGLSPIEYFFSTSGGRKGLVDTALKTAYAGYLTRKLVAVAQDIVVTEKDCGTMNGFFMGPLIHEGEILEPLRKRIVGRVTASPVIDPSTEKVIIDVNEEITEEMAEKIEKAGIEKVKIRSPLTCQSNWGICQRCYGWDLSNHKMVNLGEAVGVIAAQSIGEPGTQLTLRTFHTGGIFHKGGDIPQGLPQVTKLFEPRRQNLPSRGVRHRSGEEALISEIEGKVTIEKGEGRSLMKIKGKDNKEVIYEVGEEALVSENKVIKAGEKIIEGYINPRTLLRINGVRAVEEHLIDQAQEIYSLQGANINIKHFEIIVRQMMRKVEIVDPGDTDYLPGEEVDRKEFEETNRKVKETGGHPAAVNPVLLAIPKAAQEDKKSFLSAASFQRTKQVLAEAAIYGQVDLLKSLKGNVVVGKLVPAGTGFDSQNKEVNGSRKAAQSLRKTSAT